jgi:hypothetical protein
MLMQRSSQTGIPEKEDVSDQHQRLICMRIQLQMLLIAT